MIHLIDRSCFADKICPNFSPTMTVKPMENCSLQRLFFWCRFASFAVVPHHGHRSPDTWVNINLFLFRLFQHTSKYNKRVCLKMWPFKNGIMISKTIGFRATLFSDTPKHVHQPISAVLDVDMFWPATYTIPSPWFGCFSFFSSPLLVFFGFVFPFSSWCPILVFLLFLLWLVVYLPLWKIWKSDWIIIQTIRENKTCSKPPTR